MYDDLFEVNCYNYKRCAGLHTELLACDIKTYVKDTQVNFDPADANSILFITEGNAQINIDANTYTVRENDLIFIGLGNEFSFSVTSAGFKFLKLSYNLYIPQGSDFDGEAGTLHSRYTLCKMKIREVTNVSKFNAVYLVTHQIISEIEQQQSMYISVVRSIMTELLIILFRSEGILPSPIEHINSVALWSGPEGKHQIPADTGLRISDIEFWSGEEGQQAGDHSGHGQLLGMIHTQAYYVETDRSLDKVSCWSDETDRYFGRASQAVTSTDETTFKVWFFLPRGVKDMNLRPFINTGFVKFAIKCNKAFSFHFSMYHRASYSCISSVIEVQCSDEWKLVTIPFSSENGKNVSSFYIDAALIYIRENYMKKITLAALCEQVHLQKTYMCTLFKNHMQMSIGEYIRFYRINIAKNLLLETNYKIDEIATSVGFYDVHHFSRVFKQIVGINPSEFRNNNHLISNPNTL